MKPPDTRAVVATFIIVLFAVAYIRDPNDTMQGALLMAFAGAWGYYLGSSKGAAEANNRLDDQRKRSTDVDTTAVTASPDVDITVREVSEDGK